ncbi:MAG TPA: hypothetical protein ENK60_07405 [Anaerolineae bacterium]|nr:hypothetical protein [Anaerolineae bacterium]
MSKNQPSTHHKPRGGLLTFAIILIIISNLILAAAIHSMKGMWAPDAPLFLIWLTWLAALVSVLGGVLMWFWKKLGVYLYIAATIAITVLVFVLYAAAGGAAWGLIFGGLLPMIIVLYIIKPHWRWFT